MIVLVLKQIINTHLNNSSPFDTIMMEFNYLYYHLYDINFRNKKIIISFPLLVRLSCYED